MQIVTGVSKPVGPGEACSAKMSSIHQEIGLQVSVLLFYPIKTDINPTTCTLKVKVYYLKMVTMTSVKLNTNQEVLVVLRVKSQTISMNLRIEQGSAGQQTVRICMCSTTYGPSKTPLET